MIPIPCIVNVMRREPEDAALDNLTNDLILTAMRGENCLLPLGKRIVYMCNRLKREHADARLASIARTLIWESFELMKRYGGRAWRDDGLEITTAVPRIDGSKLWIDMIAPGRPLTEQERADIQKIIDSDVSALGDDNR